MMHMLEIYASIIKDTLHTIPIKLTNWESINFRADEVHVFIVISRTAGGEFMLVATVYSLGSEEYA